MNDLLPGMILEGAVTNVTNFRRVCRYRRSSGWHGISLGSPGGFVEIHTVVAGDIVKVKVLMDLQRKRIALTMRLDG